MTFVNSLSAPSVARVRRVFVTSLAISVLSLATAGCEDASDDGEATKEARAEVDKARTIRVELRFPQDEAYKDALYKVEFRPGEGYDVEAKNIEPLLAAAGADLVPSDGPKSCRYSDKLPRLELFIPPQKDGDPERHLISTSHCEDYAPWNVVQDGKLYVQLSGAIGEALQPLLIELDTPRFEHFSWPRPGRFELTEDAGAMPEGAQAQTAPWQEIGTLLKAAPGFAETFGEAEVDPSSVAVRCTQTVSPDCKQLDGAVTLPWQGEPFELGITMTLDGVESIDAPQDPAVFERFKSSKLYEALQKSAGEQPIVLAYDKRGDCDKVEQGAGELKPDAELSTLGCEYYMARVEHYEGAETLPPQVLYFPSLDAARLQNYADRTDLGFYEALGAREKINEAILLDKVRFYVTLDGEVHEIEK